MLIAPSAKINSQFAANTFQNASVYVVKTTTEEIHQRGGGLGGRKEG